MAETTGRARRRRRRALLVPLVGVGVATWVVRRRLAERPDLAEAGWQVLPPAPQTTAPQATAPQAAAPRPATAPAPEPAAAPVAEPEQVAEPVPAPARAVPAATTVASVTAPALPDAPYGPGSLRALADGSSPDPAYAVKGKSATKVFHAPGGSYYTRTRADVWFRTARDARMAGFSERTRRPAGQSSSESDNP